MSQLQSSNQLVLEAAVSRNIGDAVLESANRGTGESPFPVFGGMPEVEGSNYQQDFINDLLAQANEKVSRHSNTLPA